MTIGQATVTLNFAFPQGLTLEEFQEYVNDLMVELTQGEDSAMDYEVGSTFVNADPFNRGWSAKVNQMPVTLGQHLQQTKLVSVGPFSQGLK